MVRRASLRCGPTSSLVIFSRKPRQLSSARYAFSRFSVNFQYCHSAGAASAGAYRRLDGMIRTFLRVLGFIYFVAFLSFGVQATALIGARGISPYGEYLAGMRQALGLTAYWEIPSVLWLHPSDAALTSVWVTGALCAVVAVL